MPHVLITDGCTKHALAAVRSLGAKGIEVSVVSDSPDSICFRSRYCKHQVILPPAEQEEEFVEALLARLQTGRYDVLIPIGGVSCLVVSRYQELLSPYVRMVVADYTQMRIAYSKCETFRFAQENRIPMPVTFFPENQDDVRLMASGLQYPIVIKRSISAGSRHVEYSHSPSDLVSKYGAMLDARSDDQDAPPILQEYVEGTAYGFCSLFNRGEPRAIFMHRRIREQPPTGGSSVAAESVYVTQLRDLGLAILRGLRWHGVAMVEFKLDTRNQQFKLIEINPKFWGSLDLAIASGVDFPYLMYKMALDGDVAPVWRYRTGIRFRWLFPGEIEHLWSQPRAFQAICRDFFRRHVRYDVSMRDPGPSTFQIGKTLAAAAAALARRIRSRHHHSEQ